MNQVFGIGIFCSIPTKIKGKNASALIMIKTELINRRLKNELAKAFFNKSVATEYPNAAMPANKYTTSQFP